jgi:glyoxylase-like metal-dependent hydrolase (beta-lactamase superfamily II)
MTRFRMSAALLLGLIQVQPATAQESSNDLVNLAIAAEGGADALRALKGVAVKADAHFYGPEQSETAGGAPRDYGTANITITWDLARGVARTKLDRDQVYPAPAKLDYTETVTPTGGFVTPAQGAPTAMSGIRAATQLRELIRASPTLLLTAQDFPASVAAMAPQQMGEQLMPAIALTVGGTTFTVLFDDSTHLPAVIRTRDDDNVFGDSDYDLVLGDWKSVGGVKVAHSLSYQINRIEVANIAYTDVTANPSIAASAFDVPDAIRAAIKAPATGNVPYQWVIRRIFVSRFADTDGIIYEPNGSLNLVELAPNVQHVQGAAANNLIIEMQDHLVVVDAPYGDLQSSQVIDMAKARYPGKPIKYLVLSHHHNDHSGGTRAFVAEGATVIVPAPGKAHFDRTLRMPRTIVPDAAQQAGRTATVTEVTNRMTLRDDSEEINLYNVPNPHVRGFLLVHVVKSNLVYVTDLLSPPGQGRGPVTRSPRTIAVGEALTKANITGATIVGGHGTVIGQTDIASALSAQAQ